MSFATGAMQIPPAGLTNLTLLSYISDEDMNTPGKTQRAKENLRQEILDAARTIFAAEGYQNVSMRKLAVMIGYSPTTIYLYFKDKADLFHQICENSFAQLTRNIRSIQQLSNGPLEKLKAGLTEYVYFGLNNPSHYELVFISPLPVDHEVAGPYGTEAFDSLREAVKECIDADLLKGNDAELISQTLWCGIHGVTSLLIKHSSFPFVKRDVLVKHTIEVLVSGLER